MMSCSVGEETVLQLRPTNHNRRVSCADVGCVRMVHTVQDRIGLRCSLHKAIHNVARVQAHMQESLRLLQQLASQRDDQTATVADLKRRLYQRGQCTGIGDRGWLPRSIAGSR